LQLDSIGNIIELRTFSKILAPGFRLGWVIADKEIIAKIGLANKLLTFAHLLQHSTLRINSSEVATSRIILRM